MQRWVEFYSDGVATYAVNKKERQKCLRGREATIRPYVQGLENKDVNYLVIN